MTTRQTTSLIVCNFCLHNRVLSRMIRNFHRETYQCQVCHAEFPDELLYKYFVDALR